ncbi:MAG: hypothetical protein Q8928_01445 [Bacteroidota bacterium]|nr:hypothetical protein [Bacteroidota bacterium]
MYLDAYEQKGHKYLPGRIRISIFDIAHSTLEINFLRSIKTYNNQGAIVK